MGLLFDRFAFPKLEFGQYQIEWPVTIVARKTRVGVATRLMYGPPPIPYAFDGAEAGISECGKQRRLKATLSIGSSVSMAHLKLWRSIRSWPVAL